MDRGAHARAGPSPRGSRWSARTAATGGRSACSTAPMALAGLACAARSRSPSDAPAGRALSAPAPRRRSGMKSAAVGCGFGAPRCRTATPSTWSPRPAIREALETIVVVAHHDAAHSGLVFHPALPRLFAERFPAQHERSSQTRADHVRDVARARCWWRSGRCSGVAASYARGSLLAGGAARRDARHRHERGRARRQRQPQRGRRARGAGRSLAERPTPACACCCSRPARRSRSWRACRASCAATAPTLDPAARRCCAWSAWAVRRSRWSRREGMLRMRPYSDTARAAPGRCRRRRAAWSSCAGCARSPPPTRSSRCAAATPPRRWRRSTRPSSRPTTTGRATRRRTSTGRRCERAFAVADRFVRAEDGSGERG